MNQSSTHTNQPAQLHPQATEKRVLIALKHTKVKASMLPVAINLQAEEQ